jgi:hypothetical protein
MPYEIFDPASQCNPLLPLNTIVNKLTFFRINVFEVTLSELTHHKDGKIDGIIPGNNFLPRKYRLGIPLTDLFPEIRKRLKTKFIKDTLPKPIKIGIEGTYLPASKDYDKEPEITSIDLFENDLKKTA